MTPEAAKAIKSLINIRKILNRKGFLEISNEEPRSFFLNSAKLMRIRAEAPRAAKRYNEAQHAKFLEDAHVEAAKANFKKAYEENLLKLAQITLDINKGDTLLGGKYKNSPIVVDEMGTDELGQPTVNGRKLLAYRIKKKMPIKEASIRNLLKLAQLRFQ